MCAKQSDINSGFFAVVEVFLDAGFLAFQVAQVVQLALTDITAALDRHGVDGGTVGLEHALDAETVRDLADGESGIQTAVLDGNDHAFVGLHALAIAFFDFDVDHDGVAGTEVRQLAGDLFGFEFLQEVHRTPRILSFWGTPLGVFSRLL